ncbi:hypothetical protein BaRGS_00024257, partial [Batillaria attramentaria]
MINERCLTYFIKKQNLSIDESLIPYYGRHGARQFHLTFDKLFTSLRLVDHLTSMGTGCSGILRANLIEDCPLQSVNEMQKTPGGTCDYVTDTNSGLTVVGWNDNSIVNVVSNK